MPRFVCRKRSIVSRLGNLCRLPEKKIYGRELPLATAVAAQPDLQLVKPLRKSLQLEIAPGRPSYARG